MADTTAGKPAVELHFPQREIDNPTVETMTCLCPDLMFRIEEGLKKGYGYRMLVVARLLDDTRGFYEVREIRNPLIPFQFMTFPKKGKWEIAAFLFERKKLVDGRDTGTVLERKIRDKYLVERAASDRRDWGRYKGTIYEFSSIQRLCLREHWDLYGGVSIAHSVMTLEVPDVFAKPPPAWVADFGNYWHRTAPYDQCEFRARLLEMFIIKWPYAPFPLPFRFLGWAVCELAKRLVCLFLGLLGLSLALRGSWRAFQSAFSLSAKLSIDSALGELVDALSSRTFHELFSGWFGRAKYGPCFVPLALCVELLGLSALAFYAWKLLLFVIAHPLAVAGFVLVVVAVFGSFIGTLYVSGLIIKKLETREKKPVEVPTESYASRWKARRQEALHLRTLEAGKAQAAFAERHSSVLACGEAPREVSLAAVPSDMVTLRARFDALKRRVCRPF